MTPELERDFPDIWIRIATLGWVDFQVTKEDTLGGQISDEDVLHGRIDKVRKICRNAAKNAKSPIGKSKYIGRAQQYAGLQEGGLVEEFLWRADAAPNSLFGLTKKYGFEEAMRMQKERMRSKFGPLRRVP